MFGRPGKLRRRVTRRGLVAGKHVWEAFTLCILVSATVLQVIE
jgi:hypothetical protein